MNLTLWLAAALIAAVLLWAIVHVRRAFTRYHAHLLALETETGNLTLRRRMAGLTSSGGELETVTRAEHMYGWVWIVSKLRPRDQWGPVSNRMSRIAQVKATHDERIGWALTRRGARRAMMSRGEAGEVGNIVILVFGLLLLASFLEVRGAESLLRGVIDWFADLMVRLGALLRAEL